MSVSWVSATANQRPRRRCRNRWVVPCHSKSPECRQGAPSERRSSPAETRQAMENSQNNAGVPQPTTPHSDIRQERQRKGNNPQTPAPGPVKPPQPATQAAKPKFNTPPWRIEVRRGRLNGMGPERDLHYVYAPGMTGMHAGIFETPEKAKAYAECTAGRRRGHCTGSSTDCRQRPDSNRPRRRPLDPPRAPRPARPTRRARRRTGRPAQRAGRETEDSGTRRSQDVRRT